MDIPKLHLQLSEEIQARELMEERILKRARDEVARLNEEIAAERKARQETEEVRPRDSMPAGGHRPEGGDA